jgi:3-oxoacyl-[acyl-carrier-protein] synthase-3
MQGHETFRHAVARMSEATLQAIESAGLGLDDVDLFVYHQANARILRSVGERLELPAERVVDSIHHYGNTSAASIPLALTALMESGEAKSGDLALVLGYGAGLTFAGQVVVLP